MHCESFESYSREYQTPCMADMVMRSQTLSATASLNPSAISNTTSISALRTSEKLTKIAMLRKSCARVPPPFCGSRGSRFCSTGLGEGDSRFSSLSLNSSRSAIYSVSTPWRMRMLRIQHGKALDIPPKTGTDSVMGCWPMDKGVIDLCFASKKTIRTTFVSYIIDNSDAFFTSSDLARSPFRKDTIRSHS